MNLHRLLNVSLLELKKRLANGSQEYNKVAVCFLDYLEQFYAAIFRSAPFHGPGAGSSTFTARLVLSERGDTMQLRKTH